MREIIWCNEKQTLVILANFFRKYTFHILLGELSPTWDAPLSSLEMKKEHFLVPQVNIKMLDIYAQIRHVGNK